MENRNCAKMKAGGRSWAWPQLSEGLGSTLQAQAEKQKMNFLPHFGLSGSHWVHGHRAPGVSMAPGCRSMASLAPACTARLAGGCSVQTARVQPSRVKSLSPRLRESFAKAQSLYVSVQLQFLFSFQLLHGILLKLSSPVCHRNVK